jgi:hypothetical protein
VMLTGKGSVFCPTVGFVFIKMVLSRWTKVNAYKRFKR